MTMQDKQLYSLIPFEEFKALLGLDDRDDKLSRFCLTAATYSIEEFCHRRLREKKYFEDLAFYGDRVIPLMHYPVRKMLAVYAMNLNQFSSEQKTKNRIAPQLYRIVPECWEGIDTPACLVLSGAVRPLLGEFSLRVVYMAGYAAGEVPADLASACLELAAWNFNRYRGRRIGMSGNVRGNGERFELSMPENVRALLEPYRRRVI